MRLLLHPGKHVAWLKPSGRGRAVNRFGEERETMEVGHIGRNRSSYQPHRSHTDDCQGYTQRNCAARAREWAEEPSPGRYLRQAEGHFPKHLSSTQTTKAVENKPGVRDCHMSQPEEVKKNANQMLHDNLTGFQNRRM